MVSGGGPQYEEAWDPVKIGIALLILIMIISLITLVSYLYIKVSDGVDKAENCIASAKTFSNYLKAVKTKDVSLCKKSGSPIECEAEISKEVAPCLELTQLYREEKCLFAATKDINYCKQDRITWASPAPSDTWSLWAASCNPFGVLGQFGHQLGGRGLTDCQKQEHSALVVPLWLPWASKTTPQRLSWLGSESCPGGGTYPAVLIAPPVCPLGSAWR